MKRFTGMVVKTNNEKTAHVEIKSEWMHPKYLKKKTVTHVFACHDVMGVHVGDEVEVVEIRPMSATKHFRVDTVVKAAVIVEEKVASSKKQVVRKKTKK